MSDLEWCLCGKRLGATSNSPTFSLGPQSYKEDAIPAAYPTAPSLVAWEKTMLYCSSECLLVDIQSVGHPFQSPSCMMPSQSTALPPSPALSAASEKCPSPLFLASSPPIVIAPFEFSFLNRRRTK